MAGRACVDSVHDEPCLDRDGRLRTAAQARERARNGAASGWLVRGMTLRNLPIRRKVNLVTILVSTSVLTMSVVLFLAYELVNYREQLTRDLAAQAAILADNCTAAIAAGRQGLGHQDPGGAQGQAGSRAGRALRHQRPGVRAVHWQHAVDGSRGADTMWLPSAVIEGHHGMSLEGRLLGRVYISSDLRDWYARAWQSLRAAASLLVVAALLAYLLSDRLHRLVTGSIARLRESMQAVSADRDYAVRVEEPPATKSASLSTASTACSKRSSGGTRRCRTPMSSSKAAGPRSSRRSSSALAHSRN